MKKITVSVAGVAVLDTLYAKIDFDSESYQRFLSRQNGDGGLKTGQLTFAQDLEKFAKIPLREILTAISGGRPCTGQNLGGPAIVGAINAAQILFDQNISFRFFGRSGNDPEAELIRTILAGLPVDCTGYLSTQGHTPATFVLSDPNAHDGKGERTFISDVGVGGQAESSELPPCFFDADVAWFGGTALVPSLHKKLTGHLKTAKKHGMYTIVNTIFDFISKKENPSAPWTLGDGPESYHYIDLLIMDRDEACHLSGKESFAEIGAYFSASGVSVYVITHGAKEFYVWSDGRIFEAMPLTSFKISELIDREFLAHPHLRGDTTGCGDNFAGGFAASFVRQLYQGKTSKLSIRDAAAWAAASGGFACFTLGGTYIEKEPGEKYRALKRYRDAWLEQ